MGTGDFTRNEWQARGERIGWVDGEDLYLEPEAAYAATQKQGRDSGEPLTVAGRTLRKRLSERGLLVSTDHKRGTSTVRRTLESSRKDVLHTFKDFLSPRSDQTDQTDHAQTKAHTYGGSEPDMWSVSDSEPAETDQRTDQQKTRRYGENSPNGQFGQFLQREGEDNSKAHAEVNSPCPKHGARPCYLCHREEYVRLHGDPMQKLRS